MIMLLKKQLCSIAIFFQIITLISCSNSIQLNNYCNHTIIIKKASLNHVYSITIPPLQTFHTFYLCFQYQDQNQNQVQKAIEVEPSQENNNSKSIWTKMGLNMSKFIRIDHSPNRCIQAKNDNQLVVKDGSNPKKLWSIVKIQQQCSKLSGPNEPIFIVYQFRHGISINGFPIYESFIPVIIFILASVIAITILVNLFPCIFQSQTKIQILNKNAQQQLKEKSQYQSILQKNKKQ